MTVHCVGVRQEGLHDARVLAWATGLFGRGAEEDPMSDSGDGNALSFTRLCKMPRAAGQGLEQRAFWVSSAKMGAEDGMWVEVSLKRGGEKDRDRPRIVGKTVKTGNKQGDFREQQFQQMSSGRWEKQVCVPGF